MSVERVDVSISRNLGTPRWNGVQMLASNAIRQRHHAPELPFVPWVEPEIETASPTALQSINVQCRPLSAACGYLLIKHAEHPLPKLDQHHSREVHDSCLFIGTQRWQTNARGCRGYEDGSSRARSLMFHVGIAPMMMMTRTQTMKLAGGLIIPAPAVTGCGCCCCWPPLLLAFDTTAFCPMEKSC